MGHNHGNYTTKEELHISIWENGTRQVLFQNFGKGMSGKFCIVPVLSRHTVGIFNVGYETFTDFSLMGNSPAQLSFQAWAMVGDLSMRL
jgi:hypothetical protein